MYIRRSLTHTTDNATRYYSFRLCHGQRIEGKVRQKTLLNLGAHFRIDKRYWRALCSRIEALLKGQLELVPMGVAAVVEEEAHRIAELLSARKAVAVTEGKGETPPREWHHVDVHSLKTVRPRTVGVEHVGLWAMEQVGMDELFEKLGITRGLRHAATGSIIGRLAEPASEHATKRWLASASGLDEFLGCNFEKMADMQLYRASDMLHKHRKAIEDHLFARALDLFDLEPTIALYDLTNSFLEGSGKSIDKAKYGRSKERRVESAGGAPAVGSGGLSVAFAPGSIGIGGGLTAPTPPHHRAYGSVHGGSMDLSKPTWVPGPPGRYVPGGRIRVAPCELRSLPHGHRRIHRGCPTQKAALAGFSAALLA